MRTKNRKQIVFIIVILSLIAAYGYSPWGKIIGQVTAATLTSAEDTLSDSSFNASSSHTIVIDMGDANFLTAGDFIRIVFDSDFTTVASSSTQCPPEATASSTGNTVECVIDSGDLFLEATSTATTTVWGVTNPGTDGDRDITVSTHRSNKTEVESSNVKVYILDEVTVSATVNATLSFSLGTVNVGETVNNVTTTATSTATTITFGTIDYSASSTAGQRLNVTTNAEYGYTVTVQQDAELDTTGGATINSFNNSPDGTGSTTPGVWAAPTGVLNDNWTWGHMGLTVSDSTLDPNLWSGNADPFYASTTPTRYAGLNAADPMQIMYHDGPADGTTDNAGSSTIAFTIELSALQEAGEYESVLTYICTPTY